MNFAVVIGKHVFQFCIALCSYAVTSASQLSTGANRWEGWHSVSDIANAITKCIIDNGNLLAASRPSGVRWIDQLTGWVGSLTTLGGTQCFQDFAMRPVPPCWRLL